MLDFKQEKPGGIANGAIMSDRAELLLLVVVNFVLIAAIVWANSKVKRLDKQFAAVLHESGLDDLRS
ncbi:MAG: hypothetical protein M3Y13_05895, partial [Armatimonadota bacterium]|nr:hypothetical protein [Armatimonadota bacterium]